MLRRTDKKINVENSYIIIFIIIIMD